ncbi:hypothetical protein BX616_000196 [Lobosporangium transversale]|uniref:SBF-like CPA transporter family-domain-containing protein n=1 Tax=Lobosporangium transversale TaxID=64571 RepID=A0A1Y2GLX5_9FUNG|nr:SBF-like CPA transporter family-domain-containing protein [Lobosporangium transversale]KAF9908274.1 hypothetical protein BX616_000196 [Lobosporangium transversale]ORZ14851.1 SBF-like CPA transporter family-domain-containing protein [Lobosporangium transversale]|eukprot:XP_021880983.1 SBF-like CPA transporter family-domain-containing protein [Lobosporangium transversale]
MDVISTTSSAAPAPASTDLKHQQPPQHSFNLKQEYYDENLKQEYYEDSLQHSQQQQPQPQYDTDQVIKKVPASIEAESICSEPIPEAVQTEEPGSTPAGTTETNKKKVSWKTKAWDLWMKNWFLLGLVVVIILARYFPGWGRTGGPLRPEYSVKYGITACIFLLSGLSLKTKDLLTSAMNYRAHLLIQLTSFIAIPLVVKAITALVGLSSFNVTLLAGMAVTSATPTTISSNVVMTANANGNESLALFNAALGNLLGVFISPLIVLALLHSTEQTPSGRHGLDYATILRDLGTTILVPILVGQVYLYFFPKTIVWAKKKVHFPTLNSSCLLILVWTVFCDAFYNNTFASVTAGEIIAIGALQAFIFWIMTFFLGFVARVRPAKLRILKIMDLNQQAKDQQEAELEEGQEQDDEWAEKDYSHITQGLSLPRTAAQKFAEPISKEDTIAIMFCGATKSVAMGIPMIKILYSSSTGSALAGLLATPLLIYHVEQLFSGAFMVDWLKKWVGRGEETLESFEKKPKTKTKKDNTVSGIGA